MTLRAEWDPVARLVIAFLDDADPDRPRQSTGAPTTPGVTPVVVPVVSNYPDPYLSRLPTLLGPAVVRWDASANVLVREWPAADYNPTAVRAGLLRLVNDEGRFALGLTDWAVVRQMETEEPIPTDVAAQRTAIRAWLKERKATLAAAAPADLLIFETTAPAPAADLTQP